MGTIIPPPFFEPPTGSGVLCSSCWGPAKEFGDIDTPEFITVIVSGINKGPNWVLADGEPPNSLYVIEQVVPALPCLFAFIDGGFVVDVRWQPSQVVAFIQVGSFEFAFSGSTANPCEQFVLSNLDDHFTGGTMAIFVEDN